jgi:hypothetical protein
VLESSGGGRRTDEQSVFQEGAVRCQESEQRPEEREADRLVKAW